MKQPFSEPLNFFLQKTVLDYRPHQKRINHLIDLGGGELGGELGGEKVNLFHYFTFKPKI